MFHSKAKSTKLQTTQPNNQTTKQPTSQPTKPNQPTNYTPICANWPHVGPKMAPSWPMLAHVGPKLAPWWPIFQSVAKACQGVHEGSASKAWVFQDVHEGSASDVPTFDFSFGLFHLLVFELEGCFFLGASFSLPCNGGPFKTIYSNVARKWFL